MTSRCVGLALALSVGLPEVAATQRAACTTMAWSRPDTLKTVDGRYVYVEVGDALSDHGAVVLLGEPTFAFSSSGAWAVDSTRRPPLPKFGGARFVVGGAKSRAGIAELIPLPGGHASWDAPRVVRRSGRGLEVWYAVPEPQGPPTVYSAVWHDTRWEEPRRQEARTPPLYWRTGLVSRVDRAGGAVVVTVNGFSSRTSTTVIVAGEQLWAQNETPFVRFYTAAVAAGDSDLVLGYVAQDNVEDAIVAQRAVGGARDWGPPQRLHVLPRGRAQRLEVLGAPEGPVYLVWGEGSAVSGQVLHVDLSRDRGKTWVPGPPLVLHEPTIHWTPATDSLGALHLIVVPEGDAPPAHFSLADGAWDGPSTLGTQRSISRPALVPDGRRLVAAWSVPIQPGGMTLAVLLSSVGERSCRR